MALLINETIKISYDTFYLYVIENGCLETQFSFKYKTNFQILRTLLKMSIISLDKTKKDKKHKKTYFICRHRYKNCEIVTISKYEKKKCMRGTLIMVRIISPPTPQDRRLPPKGKLPEIREHSKCQLDWLTGSVLINLYTFFHKQSHTQTKGKVYHQMVV